MQANLRETHAKSITVRLLIYRFIKVGVRARFPHLYRKNSLFHLRVSLKCVIYGFALPAGGRFVKMATQKLHQFDAKSALNSEALR